MTQREKLEMAALCSRAMRYGLDPEKSVYTVSEAARALDVGPTWVYRLVESGRLQSHRVGLRAVRISMLDLVEYLDSTNGHPGRYPESRRVYEAGPAKSRMLTREQLQFEQESADLLAAPSFLDLIEAMEDAQ